MLHATHHRKPTKVQSDAVRCCWQTPPAAAAPAEGCSGQMAPEHCTAQPQAWSHAALRHMAGGKAAAHLGGRPRQRSMHVSKLVVCDRVNCMRSGILSAAPLSPAQIRVSPESTASWQAGCMHSVTFPGSCQALIEHAVRAASSRQCQRLLARDRHKLWRQPVPT